LNPKLAREILRNFDEFGLGPALSLLERWLVLDKVVVDVVAVASCHPKQDFIGNILRKQFDAAESVKSHSEIDWGARAAQLLRKALLEEPVRGDEWSDDVRKVTRQLSLAFTLFSTTTVDSCLRRLGRTSAAIRAAQPGVPWGTFGFGDYKSYGETVYRNASELARSHLGVERTLF
jgi:hypothetical protein